MVFLTSCAGLLEPCGVMAGRACHFPFQQGMMRRLGQIGELSLVAGRAHLDLCRGDLHGSLALCSVWQLAQATLLAGVCARSPIMGGVGLMTTQAFRILHRRRSGRLCAKVDHAGERAATRLYMSPAGTVTCLALMLPVTKGSMRIIGACMLGPKYAGDGGIAVAAQAGIGALLAVRGIRVRRPVRGEGVHNPAEEE